MKHIIKTIDTNHDLKRIFDEDDIRTLIYKLLEIFRIKKFNGITYMKDNNMSMAYNRDTNVILIDYEYLLYEIEQIFSYVSTIYDIDRIDYSNSIILETIIHEITHVKQKERIDSINDNISKLFKNQDEYFKTSDNPLENLANAYRLKLYREYHDYFIKEVNANFNASYMNHLIYSASNKTSLNDVLVGRLAGVILKVLENYDDVIYVHEKLIKDYDLFNETFKNNSLENKYLYGYKIEGIDKNNIKEKIRTNTLFK